VGPVRSIIKHVIRFLVLWFVNTLALWATAAIVGGIAIQSAPSAPAFVVAAGAALTVTVLNWLVRPLILLLGLPLGAIFVLLIGIFANAAVLKLTGVLLAPAFRVSTWWAAFLGSLVFAAINTILVNLLTLDDEDSYYNRVVERLAAKSPFFPKPDGEERGLLVLEIDGLGYLHLRKALEEGYMPHVQDLIDVQGYVLSPYDCGLPSQTSGCQTGIMYGRNEDVPAFRWYDKDLGKTVESSLDASTIEERYSDGTGLLRGGSSISNMFGGDAAKATMTLSRVRGGSAEEKKQKADDLYLLMLNPYFFLRTLVLFLGDVLLELWQGARQHIQNVQPRMNRLSEAFPLVRAAINVFVRDTSTYLGILDLFRGTPALYVDYVGYDEVAHHAGPWTRDAFGTLRAIDDIVGRLRRVIANKTPRPYELVLLSDHGQSFGATFEQRYGQSLEEFIKERLPHGTEVVRGVGSDDGTPSMIALAAELQNVQEQGVGGQAGRAVADGTGNLLKQGVQARQSPSETLDEDAAATVQVCTSGNIANVYFPFPGKLALSELDAAYPGLVDALVQHEGVGFVVSYEEDGTPMVLGKRGARGLHSGEVVNEDPLIPYGNPDLRAEQIRRIADYPHAGDLIVNSTLYADGTVACMEDLIGNHGGLGGEQTDAFILHPPDMEVPETKNAVDVFPILDARRGLTGAPPAPVAAPAQEVDAWAPDTLLAGIRQVGTWLGRAAHALLLHRETYQQVVDDVYMTGPGLLIGILGVLLVSLVHDGGLNWRLALGRLGLWVASVFVVWIAGRLLGGKADFTRTLRGMGFAASVYVLSLLALIPAIAPLARLLVFALGFCAAWMGASVAHELKGWRTLLLPVLAGVAFFVGAFALEVLIAGLSFTLGSLARNLGLAA
jgi:uncharacterized membrane protein YvlD (DUF360 family)